MQEVPLWYPTYNVKASKKTAADPIEDGLNLTFLDDEYRLRLV